MGKCWDLEPFAGRHVLTDDGASGDPITHVAWWLSVEQARGMRLTPDDEEWERVPLGTGILWSREHWRGAAEYLGLDQALAARLRAASDEEGEPELRAALLAACGVEAPSPGEAH